MALNRITVDSIAANAVTNVGIANGTIVSVDLADGAVTSTKLAANADAVITLSVPTGVYGNSTFIPSITVAANGRITSISNSSVSGIDAHPFVFTALGT